MKLKDSLYRYVIVLKRYWLKYKLNSFIEPQSQTNDYEIAKYLKMSFECCDKEAYVIVDTKNIKEIN